MKEVLAVIVAFPKDLFNKFFRDFCTKKCDASLQYFIYKLDGNKFFFFKLFKQFVSCSFVLVHMKNLSSIQPK